MFWSIQAGPLLTHTQRTYVRSLRPQIGSQTHGLDRGVAETTNAVTFWRAPRTCAATAAESRVETSRRMAAGPSARRHPQAARSSANSASSRGFLVRNYVGWYCTAFPSPLPPVAASLRLLLRSVPNAGPIAKNASPQTALDGFHRPFIASKGRQIHRGASDAFVPDGVKKQRQASPLSSSRLLRQGWCAGRMGILL